MNSSWDSDVNPFSTRRTRPGAIEFIFPNSADASQLVATLRENDFWGEIVGPHGSGKSTLLESLTPLLTRAGRRIERFTLHQGEHRLPMTREQSIRLDAGTLVIVDGYEQLGRFRRFRLSHLCRRRGSGLLVTAHAPMGLPPIFTTAASIDAARMVVARLVNECPGIIIADDDIVACFDRHKGNLREALFSLYDLYEQRRES